MLRLSNKGKFKNLIVSVLLGIFLFSNIGINFVHQHYHEEYIVGSDKNVSGNDNCIVCHFQGMSYEPLTQGKIEFKQISFIETYQISSEIVSISLSDFYASVQQRGPPMISLV